MTRAGFRPRYAPTPAKEGRRGIPAPFAALASPSPAGEAAAVAPRPIRHRSEAHRRFVASLPCLVCSHGRPADRSRMIAGAVSQCAHLAFAQPRARGLKAGDQFCVPLCPEHHAALDGAGDGAAWLAARAPRINAVLYAGRLWEWSINAGRVRP